MAKVLNHIYDRINRGYDKFICIDGMEGTGKSRSGLLNVLEYWYIGILKREGVPENRYGVHVKEFKTAFLNAEFLDIVALDESGDILNKTEFRSKFVTALYKVSTVIREKGHLVILVLPDFFDLPSSFRKRRVTGCFHFHTRIDNRCNDCQAWFVGENCFKCGSTDYKAGYVKYKYFTRKDLDKIIAINANYPFKRMLCGVDGIDGTVREYKGSLLKNYNKLKKEKMQDAKIIFGEAIDDLILSEKARKKCPNCASTSIKFKSTKGKYGVYSCNNCFKAWKPTKKEIEQLKKQQKLEFKE